MRPYEKKAIIEELSWHTDHPRAAYDEMTEKERSDVAQRGYVTKELWACIAIRLPKREV